MMHVKKLKVVAHALQSQVEFLMSLLVLGETIH